ncbi:MAG: Nif3-like dinuclear metal center hexameric protein [Acidobacteria bacterium]|nr:MAG: Nif3-like dinuclear metal center hexameric protein [Acidobacteriota bacterium]
MAERNKITDYLMQTFQPEKFHDSSLNGLQVTGSDEVTGICLGVDACQDLFEAAVEKKFNYIVVHHGFFWGTPFAISPMWGKRYQTLLNNGLSLFAVHLPMDANPEIGHNILISKHLGLDHLSPFGHYKGVPIGFHGRFTKPLPMAEVQLRLKKQFGDGIHLLPFGKDTISKVGVVSGAAATQEILDEAARLGIDLFVTGETDHTAFHTVKELGLNVAFCGHYETEKTSLLTLKELLEERFNVPAEFIILPTGL